MFLSCLVLFCCPGGRRCPKRRSRRSLFRCSKPLLAASSSFLWPLFFLVLGVVLLALVCVSVVCCRYFSCPALDDFENVVSAPFRLLAYKVLVLWFCVVGVYLVVVVLLLFSCLLFCCYKFHAFMLVLSVLPPSIPLMIWWLLCAGRYSDRTVGVVDVCCKARTFEQMVQLGSCTHSVPE